MQRRSWVLGALAAAAASAAARPPVTTGALRLGVDTALVESGLARSLQVAFGRDTGLGVQVIPAPVLPLLERLAAGEFDAALTNAPEAAGRLDRQGLVYDLQPIAEGDFILVGPRCRSGRSPTARETGAVLAAIHEAAASRPEGVVFLTAADGSGAHVVEQAAWRAARIAPQAPWYQPLAAGVPLIAQARARGAYAIVERGAWQALGGAPLGVLLEGDALLTEQIQAMRSFRSPHPAGRIFIGWIAGPRGRGVVGAHRGYRPPR